MNRNEKIKKVTADAGSNWLEETGKKLANKGVRKNARKLALQVLRLLREQNITQTELAERMGVSRQQVSKIVKGQENFSFETVDKLEKALGVTLMTIGIPGEMVYHTPNLQMVMSMAYSAHLTYTLSNFEHRTTDIINLWDFCITRLATLQHTPLVRKEDFLFLPHHGAWKSEPKRESTSWKSDEVRLWMNEDDWQDAQPYKLSDNELLENRMS